MLQEVEKCSFNEHFLCFFLFPCMFDQLRPLSAADASLYPTEIPWKLSPISTQFYCNFTAITILVAKPCFVKLLCGSFVNFAGFSHLYNLFKRIEHTF